MNEPVLEARVEFVPPTTNLLYITTKNGRRFPNPKFVDLMEGMSEVFTSLNAHLEPAWYKLRIYIFLPIYVKKSDTPGRVRKMDSSNRIKALEDKLAKAIGLDDRFFKEVTISKHNSVKNFTIIHIFKMSELPEDWTKDDGEDTIMSQFQ